MKTTATNIRLQFDENHNAEIVLTVKGHVEIVELKDVISRGKELTAEIKQHRRQRSLDANSYAWVLMNKIGEAMHPPIPKEEVYIEMLERYGQREPKLLSVVSDAVDMVYRATQNHCCEVGESELNGKTFKHLAILIGSSEYDTKQMSILIDGIIQDAKELGIETMTLKEITLLKSEWEK